MAMFTQNIIHVHTCTSETSSLQNHDSRAAMTIHTGTKQHVREWGLNNDEVIWDKDLSRFQNYIVNSLHLHRNRLPAQSSTIEMHDMCLNCKNYHIHRDTN